MQNRQTSALAHLELKDNRLHSILELTNAINANLAVEHLYRIFTFILKSTTKSRHWPIYCYRPTATPNP